MSGTGIAKIFNRAPSELLTVTGQVPGGYTFDAKYGSSTVISTSYVDVWPNASVLSYLTTAEVINLASTSSDDDLGGVGLEKLTITGLDSNYDVISEEVTLNGTANVPTSNSYIRVFRLRGTQSNNGANTTMNVGTITATASSSATVQGYISPSTNNSLQAQYTVPNGFYAVFYNLQITVRAGDQANFQVLVREFESVFTLRREYNLAASASEFFFNPPPIISPKSDITIRAIKLAGGGTVGATVSYGFYLVPEALVSL